MHSLRDHPNHDRPLNGGMWGGRKGAVPDMAALVRPTLILTRALIPALWHDIAGAIVQQHEA